jgi:hypothetical protein
LPDGCRIGSNRSARLPIGQGRHHLLVLNPGSFAAGSSNWRQLTSPQGLTLFLKRDAPVTATRHLGIELLKKRGWHALESFRIAAIDIIPVNEVADSARDWPDLVENRIGDQEARRYWSQGD